MLRRLGGWVCVYLLVAVIHGKAARKTALVFLADGFEDIEFAVQVDVLRRANVNVTVVSLNDNVKPITGMTGTKVTPDTDLKNITSSKILYDLLSLPGGGAAKKFAESKELGELFRNHNEKGKFVAAICLSPVAFNSFKLNYKKRITSSPFAEDRLSINYNYSNDTVVVDGNMITSRGPGTSFQYAFTLVEQLLGKETRSKLEKGMLFKI